jgi:hypothetical protein
VCVCVCVCTRVEQLCFNRRGNSVAKLQDQLNESYKQSKCMHARFIPLLLSSSYSPKWTFAYVMAFFRSLIFLDVFLQFIILHLIICPNTFPPSRSWSSPSSYNLRLTVQNLFDFSIHPFYVSNPIQSSQS